GNHTVFVGRDKEVSPNSRRDFLRGKETVTSSLRDSQQCPISAHRPPRYPAIQITVASGYGPARAPESSAPQPPGARPGRPIQYRVRFNPPTLFGPACAGPFLFHEDGRQRTDDGSSEERQRVAVRAPSTVVCRHFRKACAAPSMRPGLLASPACSSTATALTSSAATSAIGTLNVFAAPFQSPSFTQRRTTLW